MISKYDLDTLLHIKLYMKSLVPDVSCRILDTICVECRKVSILHCNDPVMFFQDIAGKPSQTEENETKVTTKSNWSCEEKSFRCFENQLLVYIQHTIGWTSFSEWDPVKGTKRKQALDRYGEGEQTIITTIESTLDCNLQQIKHQKIPIDHAHSPGELLHDVQNKSQLAHSRG